MASSAGHVFRATALLILATLVVMGLSSRGLLAFGDPNRATSRAGVTPPAVGRLLVARPSLPDPNFVDAVVLLLEYGDQEGALGVVVNRRSGLALEKALPDVKALAGRTDSLYLGGPVSLETVVVLLNGPDPPPTAVDILPDVYLIRGHDELLTSNLAEERVRFYAGYAGWSPGQLEEEIEQGVWEVLSGDSRWIFSDTPDETWERLIRILFGPTA